MSHFFASRALAVAPLAIFLFLPQSTQAGPCDSLLSKLRAIAAKLRSVLAGETESPFRKLDTVIVDGVAVHLEYLEGNKRPHVRIGDSPSTLDRTPRGFKELEGWLDGRFDPKDATYPPDLLQIEPGAKLLDVGCSDGHFVRQCQEREIEAIGIDIYLNETQRQQPDLFRQAFAKNLPFEAARFDYVYSNWSVFLYDHKPSDYITHLREMIRVTKRGGRIRIGPFHLQNLPEVQSALPMLKVTRKPTGEGAELTYQGENWEGGEFIEFTVER